MQRISSEADLRDAITRLLAVEPRFDKIIESYGVPPLRLVEPGLRSLLRIITDQLISLSAGRAIWNRLEPRLAPFDPATVIMAGEAELRRLGLSRAKAKTFIAAASAFSTDEFSVARTSDLTLEQACRLLTAIPGVGQWTANIYALSALRAADAWPSGDLALQVAFGELAKLGYRPSVTEMEALAEPWRPFRSVAARILWCHYRSVKGLSQGLI